MLLMVSASAATSPLEATVRFCFKSPSATAVTTLTMPRTCSVRLAAMTLTVSVRSFQVPGDARHLRLAAQAAFGAHLARHAGHFAGEAVQLVDHGVDGVLELEDFALHVHGDLARQVAARHRGRHLGDVAHLGGQIGREQVHVVGQILPGAGDARHHGLAAQAPVGADFARDARHLAGEGAQLIDHGVQRFLQEQDLAAHVHRDLARQVAGRDRGRHLGDVAHLAR